MTKSPMTEIAEESPEAAGLVHEILSASARGIQATMDRLYEGEKERRQALEVLIDRVLDNLDVAHMGSAREYEDAVRPLRFGAPLELARLHHENTEGR